MKMDVFVMFIKYNEYFLISSRSFKLFLNMIVGVHLKISAWSSSYFICRGTYTKSNSE